MNGKNNTTNYIRGVEIAPDSCIGEIVEVTNCRSCYNVTHDYNGYDIGEKIQFTLCGKNLRESVMNNYAINAGLLAEDMVKYDFSWKKIVI
jgi:hypothetical protein